MNSNIDLKINNYSEKEILNLLNIKHSNLNIDILFETIFKKIKLLLEYNDDNDDDDDDDDTDNANANKRNVMIQDSLEFFKNCFIKICCLNNLSCSKKMIQTIDNIIPITFSETQALISITKEETTTIAKVEDTQSANVIKHPNLQTIATYNQEIIGDTLNPIKRRILKQQLLIDTRFRKDYDITKSTNFSIQLPTVIKNVISMKLAAFEFPITSYVISDSLKSNIMTVIYNGTDVVITIKAGNYTAGELVTYLNSLIFNAAPFTAGNVEASFDTKYGKFIFQLTAVGIAAGDTIDLNFTIEEEPTRNLMHNFGWIVGYRNPLYSNEISYVPEGQADIGGTRYIYVIINDFKRNVNDNFIGAFETSLTKSNILARIPQPAGMTEIIFNDNSDLLLKKRDYFGPVNIERLQIQVLDDYERIIDTNKMDYSMALEFECVYNL